MDMNRPVRVTQNLDTVSEFVFTPVPGFSNRELFTLLKRNFEEKVEFSSFNTRFRANAVMGDGTLQPDGLLVFLNPQNSALRYLREMWASKERKFTNN